MASLNYVSYRPVRYPFPAEEMHWYVSKVDGMVVQLVSDCVQYTNDNTTVQHGARDYYAGGWDHDAALDASLYAPPAGVVCSESEAAAVDLGSLWASRAGFGGR